MKRYIIELNGAFVADSDSVYTAKKQFNRFCERYPEPHNMVRVWDTEQGVRYKNFPLVEQNEDND